MPKAFANVFKKEFCNRFNSHCRFSYGPFNKKRAFVQSNQSILAHFTETHLRILASVSLWQRYYS